MRASRDGESHGSVIGRPHPSFQISVSQSFVTLLAFSVMLEMCNSVARCGDLRRQAEGAGLTIYLAPGAATERHGENAIGADTVPGTGQHGRSCTRERLGIHHLGRRDGCADRLAELVGDVPRPAGNLAAQPADRAPHPGHVAIRDVAGLGPGPGFFYNDAYRPMTLGAKHPWALGRPASEVWAEIWQDIGPRAEARAATGDATWDEGLLLFLERSGYPEETYHTFSYSPLPDDDGEIGGMLCVVTEDTERVIGERRLGTLRGWPRNLPRCAPSPTSARAIATRARDQPARPAVHAHLAVRPEGDTRAWPADRHRRRPCRRAATARLPPLAHSVWPAHRILRGTIHDGRWTSCHLLRSRPVPGTGRRIWRWRCRSSSRDRPPGGHVLVAGINPYRPLTTYAGFVDLVAAQIASGLASARAYEAERQRAEALAEIDRAKTAFFSNVSHEFRTPLTLMLGPLEEEIAGRDAGRHAALAMVHRNGLRLLRLVNTLLDFSRIEAGRVRASLPAHRPRAVHRRAGQQFPLGLRARRPALWSSNARRWRSRCTSIADMWERSCSI